jgi:redox-sensitive bicupin YhaK (pirin superfamily)
VHSEDGLVRVNVIAGSLLGSKGSNPSTDTSECCNDILYERREGNYPASCLTQRLSYLLDGKVTIEGYGLAEAFHAVVFNNDGEGITVEALEDTRALLMSGEPLNEKVEAMGRLL